MTKVTWYRVINTQTKLILGIFPSRSSANRVRLAMGWIRDTVVYEMK